MDYIVVELPKLEKTKVQLKAALAGLSLNEFMIQAVNGTDIKAKPIHCTCGKKTEVINKPYSYKFNFVGKNKKITILNTPQQQCNHCNVIGLSSTQEYYIEKLLTKAINNSMKNYNRLPDFLDFNDLIKIKI